MQTGQQKDDWALAKETLRKIAPGASWNCMMDAIHSGDPETYGTMLWWLHQRKEEGKGFRDLYMQISYVMGVGTTNKRLERFRELNLPVPGYKPEHLESRFGDFLIDLKRTLQVLEPDCANIRFHTAI